MNQKQKTYAVHINEPTDFLRTGFVSWKPEFFVQLVSDANFLEPFTDGCRAFKVGIVDARNRRLCRGFIGSHIPPTRLEWVLHFALLI